MRAWRFSEFGDIKNFQLGEHPEPDLENGDLLIKLNFAALNPADRLLVEGRYPGAGELPLTVGRDGSGTIEDAKGSDRFANGDTVIVLRSEVGITRQGTLAEYVAVPERYLAPLPEGWTMEEGAAGPLVYLTAWKALKIQGGVQAGEDVLVTGASGGVGVAAIQLAKALGARVVALSRDEEKRQKLLALGADVVLDSSAADLEDQIRDASDGGVDLIVENLSGPFIQTGINVANLNARIMVIGLLAGPVAEIQLGLVLFKQVRIEGVHVGKFLPAEATAAWHDIVQTLEGAGAKPLVDRVFPMEEVQEAFTHLAGGHLGKVLVNVAG
ncbi:MAG: zinc-binding dehydrogenase [Candidatus Hydrogenedentes bacterium]|nr:zinc-binding dehydrogenase [Candidatus Hydrogenedentota bacterium]